MRNNMAKARGQWSSRAGTELTVTQSRRVVLDSSPLFPPPFPLPSFFLPIVLKPFFFYHLEAVRILEDFTYFSINILSEN